MSNQGPGSNHLGSYALIREQDSHAPREFPARLPREAFKWKSYSSRRATIGTRLDYDLNLRLSKNLSNAASLSYKARVERFTTSSGISGLPNYKKIQRSWMEAEKYYGYPKNIYLLVMRVCCVKVDLRCTVFQVIVQI